MFYSLTHIKIRLFHLPLLKSQNGNPFKSNRSYLWIKSEGKVKMKVKQLRLSDSDLAFIEKQKGKTFSDKLRDALNRAREVESYREKLSQLVKEKEKAEPLETLICLHRVRINAKDYCTRLAPNAKELISIKICAGCPHRITKEGLIFRKATGKKPSPLKERAYSMKHPAREFCKRDQEWFLYPNKDCIGCTWTTTECKVKTRALKDRIE